MLPQEQEKRKRKKLEQMLYERDHRLLEKEAIIKDLKCVCDAVRILCLWSLCYLHLMPEFLALHTVYFAFPFNFLRFTSIISIVGRFVIFCLVDQHPPWSRPGLPRQESKYHGIKIPLQKGFETCFENLILNAIAV